MATTKATIFATATALLPPAIATTVYLVDSSYVTALSLSTKAVSLLLYALLVYKVTYCYATDPLNRFPAVPNDHWLFGHILSLLDRPPGKSFLVWMKQVPNDGILVFRAIFHVSTRILITTPEKAMEVLNSHSYDWEKPARPRAFLRRVLGDGLVVVEGNEHKIQRRNVAPAFTGKNIRELIPLFWKKSVSFTEAIGRETSETAGSLQFEKIASRVTLDIIGVAGLGKDFSTTENADHELAIQYERITNPDRGFLPLYIAIDAIFPLSIVRHFPFGANGRVARAMYEMRRIVDVLLNEKAQAIESEKTDKQKDIIATLIRGGKFDNNGLTNTLLTFLAAGHETTANALTWIVYLLCKHTEVQTRLRKDCQVAFGHLASDEHPTTEQIDAVPFLDAVCNETLRFYPTVPVTARVAVRETRIGDEVIPKGSFAILSLWALNRLPSYWGPDGEKFNPDRWLGAEAAKSGGASSPYSFLTFLYGPRSCIGQSFARYELKCLLAVLLLKYELRMKDPSYVPEPGAALNITLRPVDGLAIIVTPVK